MIGAHIRQFGGSNLINHDCGSHQVRYGAKPLVSWPSLSRPSMLQG
jgi:hypothetical protein